MTIAWHYYCHTRFNEYGNPIPVSRIYNVIWYLGYEIAEYQLWDEFGEIIGD